VLFKKSPLPQNLKKSLHCALHGMTASTPAICFLRCWERLHTWADYSQIPEWSSTIPFEQFQLHYCKPGLLSIKHTPLLGVITGHQVPAFCISLLTTKYVG